MNRDVIRTTCFAQGTVGFISSLCKFLKVQVCLPTDYLMHEGDIAENAINSDDERSSTSEESVPEYT